MLKERHGFVCLNLIKENSIDWKCLLSVCHSVVFLKYLQFEWHRYADWRDGLTILHNMDFAIHLITDGLLMQFIIQVQSHVHLTFLFFASESVNIAMCSHKCTEWEQWPMLLMIFPHYPNSMENMCGCNCISDCFGLFNRVRIGSL